MNAISLVVTVFFSTADAGAQPTPVNEHDVVEMPNVAHLSAEVSGGAWLLGAPPTYVAADPTTPRQSLLWRILPSGELVRWPVDGLKSAETIASDPAGGVWAGGDDFACFIGEDRVCRQIAVPPSSDASRFGIVALGGGRAVYFRVLRSTRVTQVMTLLSGADAASPLTTLEGELTHAQIDSRDGLTGVLYKDAEHSSWQPARFNGERWSVGDPVGSDELEWSTIVLSDRDGGFYFVCSSNKLEKRGVTHVFQDGARLTAALPLHMLGDVAQTLPGGNLVVASKGGQFAEYGADLRSPSQPQQIQMPSWWLDQPNPMGVEFEVVVGEVGGELWFRQTHGALVLHHDESGWTSWADKLRATNGRDAQLARNSPRTIQFSPQPLIPIAAATVSLAAMTTAATLVGQNPWFENILPPLGGGLLAVLPLMFLDGGLSDPDTRYGSGKIILGLGAIASPFAAALGSWGLAGITTPGGSYWGALAGAAVAELAAILVHFIFEKLPDDLHLHWTKLAIESSLMGGGATLGYQLSRKR